MEKTIKEPIEFFEDMIASASHEIKNVFAVINENLGLIEDFNIMAAKGIPLNSEKLNSITSKLKRQITRGNRIVENINKLAHSPNKLFREIDLEETIVLIIELAERFASMNKTVLKFQPRETVTIYTSPFILKNLIWVCLKSIIEKGSGDRSVIFVTDKKDDEAIIRMRFLGVSDFDELAQEILYRDNIKEISEQLKASLACDIKTFEINISLSMLKK